MFEETPKDDFALTRRESCLTEVIDDISDMSVGEFVWVDRSDAGSWVPRSRFVIYAHPSEMEA